MFGYVKVFKPEMKICEYDCYRGVYCGLCKQLGKSFGQLSRLGLSYDLTFLSVLMLSLKDESVGFEQSRCIAKPFRKKLCFKGCKELEFCAACSMIISYYKLKDNFIDGSFLKKLKLIFVYPFFALKHKKAKKLYKNVDDIFKTYISNQLKVEKGESYSIDAAAEPTAKALSQLCVLISPNEAQNQVLAHFGYLLGRYIYFMDALDDLEEDVKANTFNPFIQKFSADTKNINLAEIKEYAKEAINLTLGQLAASYELIEIKNYKSILDNIIYLGFKAELKRVLEKNNRKEKSYAESV